VTVARAPASSANLGPGFDTLGLALGLWVEVEVTPAERLSLTTSGEGADLPADESHLAARVAIEVSGHRGLDIRVHSDIPLGRGLGSSAAVAVAAAGAAGADRAQALEIATRHDGHPENAAASVYGGLVAAARVGTQLVCEPLPLDTALGFILLVPDRQLSTSEARRALPDSVAHVDARFNLGRLALLLAGLADHRRLVPAAGEDRLHQPFRTPLFPESEALMAAMVAGGALASCWSGAGPSIIAFAVNPELGALEEAARQALAAVGVAGRVLALPADRRGLTVRAQG
jgi:homoserine kinase